ncbi:MAG: hypothetical protein H5T98_10205 [Syntrophomonadaceae bacterium]|nr:hypothetical protein [Syntrophomonadaceae bacterium]
MRKRWGKGEPVNLSDLLKITPVANEILHLSEELEINPTDVMWIVAQIIIDNNDMSLQNYAKIFESGEAVIDDEWDDDIDLENMEDEMEQNVYTVNVKITSNNRFPEIGFKAGINDKEDISYFFEMVIEMLDKLE